MKTKLIVVLVASCWMIAGAQTSRRATATAIVSGGFVVGVTVTDGGYGYTAEPPVHVIGGGGSNAVVTASISNSVVTSITVNNPGTGYGSTPVVSVAPPVMPLPEMEVLPASHLLFTNLKIYHPGSVTDGYFLMKNIAGVWVNQQPMFGRGGVFIASYDGTHSIHVDAAVASNTYALAAFPIPIQAVATAQVMNGFVTEITITNYGLGYTTAPPVQITGGGGSGAVAQASISPVAFAFPTEVSSITILNPGSGYTTAPNVVIGPPDATLQFASPPIITPEILLGVSNLVTNLTYELQASPDLTTWTNVGSPFLMSTSTKTSFGYMYPTNGGAFYRLHYIP